MALVKIFLPLGLNGKFLSSILPLLLLISPIFTFVDPYSEYGSGSSKLLNTDLRIPNTGF